MVWGVAGCEREQAGLNLLAYLMQGIGYGMAAVAQPGPFQAYLIGQATRHGWRRTLPAALAPLVSDGPMLVIVLLVLNQIPLSVQRVLYVAGGLYVLYLAWNAFRGWRTYDDSEPDSSSTGTESLRHAALVNVLSPSPYLFWSLVTGPILIAGWRETPANGIGFLVGFYLAMILGMGTVILLFSSASRLGRHFSRTVLGVSALLLSGFGLFQIAKGISGMG